MTRSAISILVFGIYLSIVGLILIVGPNLLLTSIKLPLTNDPWIRLMGMLLFVLAFFYIQSARYGFKPFFTWTLYTRFGAVLILLPLVLLGFLEPIVLVFWLGDLAGAIWTLVTLLQEKQLTYA
jgi:hypothetical protein